jgi:putative hydrolase of the HAD superfamily
MSFSTIFFDLDDTLYPPSSGVWDAIGERINLYMCQRVGISPDEVTALREHLYHTYGTTLRGLTLTRGIDPRDYLAFVHDIPLQDYLTPDPSLPPLLKSIALRKVIFTNADRAHARRVLSILGVEDCFDQIIDVLDVAPYCKPMTEAFLQALELAGVSSPAEAIFIDDAPHNLRAARAMGFYTIRMGNSSADGCCHAVIQTLHDLPALLLSLQPPHPEEM